MSNKCPCKGCLERKTGGEVSCHATCEKYKEYAQRVRQAKRALNKDCRTISSAKTSHNTLRKFRRKK